MEQTNVPIVTLNNGVKMPQLGLGVWQSAEGDEAVNAVLTALETGYRLIDTAAAYQNEESVGTALRESGLPREEIFVTTKLWNADQGFDSTLKAFDTSMKKLQLDYLDLYLIHWPMPAKDTFKETWQAFERLYAEKRIRAIGISNFQPDHLEELLASSEIVPAVNQIELHPYLQQHETRDFCGQHDIKIESWSPIGGKDGNVLDDPEIAKIAGKYGRSPAQVVIRWHLQSGFIVIPKSVHSERIKENFDVLNFALDDSDMEVIDGLHSGTRVGPDPATANFS